VRIEYCAKHLTVFIKCDNRKIRLAVRNLEMMYILSLYPSQPEMPNKVHFMNTKSGPE